MLSTVTNRSAALAGVWTAAGLFAYASIADYLFGFHEVVYWFATVLVVGAVSSIPYFKWVVGVDFKPNEDGLSFRKEWNASQKLISRTGIWLMSASGVGATLGIMKRVLFG